MGPMGSAWGQHGVSMGSAWGQGGVSMGSAWGQGGVSIGSGWGQNCDGVHANTASMMIGVCHTQQRVQGILGQYIQHHTKHRVHISSQANPAEGRQHFSRHALSYHTQRKGVNTSRTPMLITLQSRYLQVHSGVNFFILDSIRPRQWPIILTPCPYGPIWIPYAQGSGLSRTYSKVAPAPKVLGSDIKTHLKTRFCLQAIWNKKGRDVRSSDCRAMPHQGILGLYI